MAPRALGLAAPAHAQLAEPSAGLSLRRPRSRRLHDDGARWSRSSRVSPRSRVRRSARNTTVTSVARADEAITSRTSSGELRCRSRRHRERRVQPAERPGASPRVPASIAHVTPFDYRNPAQLPRGRRARRRRVGDRRAARRRDPSLRPARDALGRRARPAAADVSRPRRALVDGRLGRLEPALRRDRRPDARAAAAVAAARRHARARDARSERAQRDRRGAGRPPGGRPRRPRAVLGRTAQSVRARRSQDGAPARHVRRVGARASSRGARSASPRALRADARARVVTSPDRSAAAANSSRSSGPPASVRTTAGCTCRSWTRRDTCATTAGSWTAPACTRSACRCCGGGSRASFTASKTTRATSSIISPATWRPAKAGDCGEQRNLGHAVQLDAIHLRAARVQPAHRHPWRRDRGRRVSHGLAVDHRRHPELREASDVRGTWLESHFRWQIRTFWFGLLWVALCLFFIVGTLGIGILIAWLPLAFVSLWFIYRIRPRLDGAARRAPDVHLGFSGWR